MNDIWKEDAMLTIDTRLASARTDGWITTQEDIVEINLTRSAGEGAWSRREDVNVSRDGAGVLILSMNFDVLYVNTPGRRMMSQMDMGKSVSSGSRPLPLEIREMCSDIPSLVAGQAIIATGAQVEIFRKTATAEQPIGLRSFWIPGSSGQRSRILIILQPSHRQTQPPA
ncbi:MAG: hypothetical protein ACT4OO_05085 [Nitrospiraceae bacterium]